MNKLLFVLLPVLCFAQQPRRIVISTSTILDGKGGVLKDQQIVIEGSEIRTVAAGKAKPDYDLRGLTVMPGWIDTHIHLNWHLDPNNKSVNSGGKPEDMALATAADAWITLQEGFTTVQSVGAAVDANVRDFVARGILPGPRILTSFRQIQGTSQDKTRPTPEALRELVRKTKQDGADVIKLFATTGTHKILEAAGVPAVHLHKLAKGRRPNVLDMLKNGNISLIINTPAGKTPRVDEVQIRSAAVTHKIPIMTTLTGAHAALLGIKAYREKGLSVCSLQEYHAALRCM